jgi:predicted RNA-binding protein YlxR (DUF448 family)
VARLELRDAAGSSERTCIVTRLKGPPQEMIRFVIGPGQIVVPDIRRKLPGRGVWVSARAGVVTKAVKHQLFSRSFKTKVIASDSLANEIDVLLTKDCLQALSLANKAGQVAAGFTKVEEAITAAAPVALVHAADGAADGRRKLDEALRRRYGDSSAVARIDLFWSSQLNLALGRTNVVHAVLIGGAASEGFLERCQRLTLFRAAPPPAEGSDRTSLPVSNKKLDELPALRRGETELAGTQD